MFPQNEHAACRTDRLPRGLVSSCRGIAAGRLLADLRSPLILACLETCVCSSFVGILNLPRYILLSATLLVNGSATGNVIRDTRLPGSRRPATLCTTVHKERYTKNDHIRIYVYTNSCGIPGDGLVAVQFISKSQTHSAPGRDELFDETVEHAATTDAITPEQILFRKHDLQTRKSTPFWFLEMNRFRCLHYDGLNELACFANTAPKKSLRIIYQSIRSP